LLNLKTIKCKKNLKELIGTCYDSENDELIIRKYFIYKKNVCKRYFEISN
jgi:hypothetical protein